MKNIVLKRIAALAAVAVITLAGTYDIYAAGTKIKPAEERVTTTEKASSKSEKSDKADADEGKSSSSSSKSSSTKSTAAPKSTASSSAKKAETKNVLEQQPVAVGTTEHTNCVTKLGAFGWFILSVLVNLIISFAIGYRFFKMGKRDTHVLAEMRAIKKDIDAKMQSNIGGFSEYETRVSNQNRSYAKAETNIKSNYVKPEDDGSQEIYKKWEAQLGADISREEEAVQPEKQPDFEAENNNESDELERIAKSITVTERTSPYRSEEMPRTAEGYRRPAPSAARKAQAKDSVMGKLKGIINSVLPFDEEE